MAADQKRQKYRNGQSRNFQTLLLHMIDFGNFPIVRPRKIRDLEHLGRDLHIHSGLVPESAYPVNDLAEDAELHVPIH